MKAILMFALQATMIAFAMAAPQASHAEEQTDRSVCARFLSHTPENTEPGYCHRQAIDWLRATQPSSGASFFAYMNNSFDQNYAPELRPTNECRLFFLNLFTEARRGELVLTHALFDDSQEEESLNRLYTNYQTCSDYLAHY
jgi:hypothetical protein